MDALQEYVYNNIDKRLQESDYLIAVPAIIKEPLDNGMYVVKILTTDTELILPNWSGTELDVNDNVHIFYKGKTLSERTAYIGASLFKAEGSNRNKIKYIIGSNFDGEVGETARSVCEIVWESVQNQNVFISFNANVLGNDDGDLALYIYMDETLHEFQPIMTIEQDKKYTQNFLLPFKADVGMHTVKIQATGVGEYTDIYGYVFGQGLREDADDYDRTNENDYVYIGGTIIYYKGRSRRPAIPTTLDGNPVTELQLTAFNNSKVEAVKIPEGVLIID